MKPLAWPEWMEHLKAKSEKYGGESLAQHTWDVLVKLAELQRLRPDLPTQVGVARLWHCLFWACLLHDFGKAARGFQARLAGGPHWPQRHEVLSLAFLDWIAPALSTDEQTWVLAAIVSHHRDASYITQTYAAVDADPLLPLLAEIDQETVEHLWRWVAECATAWRDALGFGAHLVAELLPIERQVAIGLVCERGVRHIREWLDRYADWLDSLPYAPVTTRILGVLLRGLTTSADHMASAHLERMPEAVQEPWHMLAARILKPGQTTYYHQEHSAAAADGSVVLIAPTGSGKTEAALYWALGDGLQAVSRLFYALPYQASMNAMYDRLRDEKRGFGTAAVGIQHGRALQAMYSRLIDLESDSGAQQRRSAADDARWQRNINTLHARPVKVFSPYQMLKAMFQLRGFEAMLTDYAQAAFVFDEIHAYDPARLALVFALIKHLRTYYGARFFVMSATFPKLIREQLPVVLGEHTTIRADAAVFAKFRRHRLHLLPGELLTDGVARIVQDVQAGRRVLACTNTVRNAQTLREALLMAGLSTDQIILIHSRFIIRDRTALEQQVRDWCGMNVAGRQGFVLVATQVVEVSLNIDLDTMYTEPAPLEALLQRFGRVNRACTKGICPVYVYTQPVDGQGVYGRHPDKQQQGQIVRATLAELAKHDGQEVDEAQTNDWLDTIYSDSLLTSQWQADYNRTTQQAEDILQSLCPFDSSAQLEDQFEALFDNIDVLPKKFETLYLEHLARHEYLEASQYFVGISTRKYAQLARQGLVRPAASDEKRRKWVVVLEYDDTFGLSFETTPKDPDWD